MDKLRIFQDCLGELFPICFGLGRLKGMDFKQGGNSKAILWVWTEADKELFQALKREGRGEHEN